jgi:hypothetical protein
MVGKIMLGMLKRGCCSTRGDCAGAKRAAMVERSITSSNNVIDLAGYRERNVDATGMATRTCRHCGAALQEGEREEECSSTFNIDTARLRWQAAQILRGLI